MKILNDFADFLSYVAQVIRVQRSMPRPGRVTVTPVGEVFGMRDGIRFVVALPEVSVPNDIEKVVVAYGFDGLWFSKELAPTETSTEVLIPQGSEFTVRADYVDNAGNLAVGETVTEVANDTVAPTIPGPVSLTAVGEVIGAFEDLPAPEVPSEEPPVA